MKLWLLERTDTVDWDEYEGFVVRAETEEQARRVAHDSTGYTHPEELALMSCVPLEVAGEAEVILAAYNAG